MILSLLFVIGASAAILPPLPNAHARPLDGAESVLVQMLHQNNSRLLAPSQTSPPASDPGCTSYSTTPWSVPSSSLCVSYSCQGFFDSTAGLISSSRCRCLNSNDCFGTWSASSGTKTLTPVCNGANFASGSAGTCVTGATVPGITYPSGVVATPDNGCYTGLPCLSTDGKCNSANCPAKLQCSSSIGGCSCSSDADCVNSFSLSLYTPSCISNYCAPAPPSPSPTPSRTPSPSPSASNIPAGCGCSDRRQPACTGSRCISTTSLCTTTTDSTVISGVPNPTSAITCYQSVSQGSLPSGLGSTTSVIGWCTAYTGKCNTQSDGTHAGYGGGSTLFCPVGVSTGATVTYQMPFSTTAASSSTTGLAALLSGELFVCSTSFCNTLNNCASTSTPDAVAVSPVVVAAAAASSIIVVGVIIGVSVCMCRRAKSPTGGSSKSTAPVEYVTTQYPEGAFALNPVVAYGGRQPSALPPPPGLPPPPPQWPQQMVPPPQWPYTVPPPPGAPPPPQRG